MAHKVHDLQGFVWSHVNIVVLHNCNEHGDPLQWFSSCMTAKVGPLKRIQTIFSGKGWYIDWLKASAKVAIHISIYMNWMSSVVPNCGISSIAVLGIVEFDDVVLTFALWLIFSVPLLFYWEAIFLFPIQDSHCAHFICSLPSA